VITTVTKPAWKTYEPVDLADQIGEFSDDHVEGHARDGWVEVKGVHQPRLVRADRRYKEWSAPWHKWPDEPAEQEECRGAREVAI
jgi:hypothetical protein